jgi:hypothetical protein
LMFCHSGVRVEMPQLRVQIRRYIIVERDSNTGSILGCGNGDGMSHRDKNVTVQVTEGRRKVM